MPVIKLIIISIISAIFLFGNAESQDGLIKTLARGIRDTVDNTVDMVEDRAGTGLVGHVLTGAGNLAKDAIDGTERIVSVADDHLGDAARAAHHSLFCEAAWDKKVLSSSVCRRFPNCPQDRIFNAKCELQSIMHIVEV
ncbi:hypothetical protein AVEN_40788-1 [Araneus ventricosus]|uniref:Kazal-like domain-containing protein n=1 Tax=Araneus ventricosus TaxID=182803 RepID=A0A4Y2CER1_ARAVE|nr:hypothetical protein AVEN_40788-1 [Araneus ventricosus]